MPDEAANSRNSFSSATAGWPLWAKITTFFGFPTAVAGFLLYFVVSTISQTIREQGVVMGAHNQMTVEIRDRLTEQKITLANMLYTLQVMCQHGAKSDQEHRECVIK